MDKEGASENATPKMEKRIKSKSKKDKKNEQSAAGMQDGQSVDTTGAIEHVRVSEREDISEMKKVHKRVKEKKTNKGTKDIEANAKKDAGEGESTLAYGEDGSGDAVEYAARKKKKREKNKNKNDRFEMENGSETVGNESEKCLEEESTSGTNSIKETSKEMKKQKKKRKLVDTDFEKDGEKDGKEAGTDERNKEIEVMEMVERKKRKKEKKKSKGDDLSLVQTENVPDNVEGDITSINDAKNVVKELGRKKKKKNKKKENFKDDSSAAHQNSVDKDGPQNNKAEEDKKRKKKGTKLVENGSDDTQDNGVDATPNKSNKKVRFSDQDEVFPLPSDELIDKEDLVRAKRFTPEEDEIIKKAVQNYIEDHDLGEEGLEMVLNSRKHSKVRGCWAEIASAIPYRPREAVYYRGQILFRRSESRSWTQEEYDMIRKHYEEHGSDWKGLADELGKHRFHVKDTWRRIKLQNTNKGHWSQQEYQRLFDLVNLDLQLKITEDKKSKHGMLRDNICWTAISDNLATRHGAGCCMKWYDQLTSPMVAEGLWKDTDDYRLIDALYNLDSTCMEDVDWDNLVEGRLGDVCKKRWNQMTLHIGNHGRKSFAEQVEVLAKRYCSNLIEAREAWDNKPRVP